MMKKDDTVIDVNPRETVMRGKTPRRLLWIIGVTFLILLMVMSVFIVNGKDNTKKKTDDEKKAVAAKEAAPKPTEAVTVESIEKEQTKKALDFVKGAPVVTTEVQAELNQLKGDGNKSNSAVEKSTSTGVTRQNASQTSNVNNTVADAAQQAREKISTAPIFSSRGTRTSNAGGNSAALSGQIDLLKQLGERRSASVGADPASLLKQALESGSNTKANNKSASNELDFNAEMSNRQLNAPTGLIPKSKNNCLLTPGWLIPVANVEAMNSDVPGEITLVVREDVYDSLTNTCKAIPKGSKIIAVYNPNVKVGQERFNIASSVLYLPNGKHVPMLGTNAYSPDGTAGIDADVNNHFFKMFGTALLLGFVDKMTSNDTVSTSSANGSTTTNTSVLGQTLGNTANAILQRNSQISPTLTRDHATRFNLKVSREFYMEQYRD